MSKRTRRDESLGSKSQDSETIDVHRKKRSDASGKLRVQVESSVEKAPRKRETYTEEQKEYPAEQHKKLRNWEIIGKAFRDKFPEKAHVKDRKLQGVLKTIRSKKGIKLTEDPDLMAGGTKYSLAEYEFLVNEVSSGADWKTVAKTFHSKFKDRGEPTVRQLRSVFRNIRLVNKRVPENLQRRAEACAKDKQLKKAQFDLTILRIYRDHPHEDPAAKAHRIWATDAFAAYKKLYPSWKFRIDFFAVRHGSLEDRKITIRKLEAFIEEGRGTNVGCPFDDITHRNTDEIKAGVYHDEETFSNSEVGDEYEDVDGDEPSELEDLDEGDVPWESETDDEEIDDEDEQVKNLLQAFSDSDISESAELVRDDSTTEVEL